MKAAKILTFLLVLAAFAQSCRIADEYRSDAYSHTLSQSKTFDNVMVRKSGNLLYAQLPGIGRQPGGTRADAASDLVSLESLLDRSQTKTRVFKNYRIVQIAFKDLDYGQTAVLADEKTAHPDETSDVRKFLVETVDTVANDRNIFVATLVPTPENCERFGPDSYSYIDKRTFEGLIIFSDLDGKLRGINSYGMRPIRLAKVIRPEDTDKYICVRYLSIYSSAKTRSGLDENEIEASICIGEKSDGDIDNDDEEDIDNDNDDRDINDDPDEGGGGGMDGGTINPSVITEDANKDEAQSLKDSLKRKNNEVIRYIVELSSHGNGEVFGSGSYPERDSYWAVCEALPGVNACFDRWTGDFHGHGQILEFLVNQDISSTAYFADSDGDPVDPYDPVNRPCFNDSTEIGNPVYSMSIASPGYSGLRGGTYGYVRSGDKRFHCGLDLKAEVGTPVYAMIDGTISAQSYVISQPDKETEEYPDGYTGDDNPAGNRVTIKGEVNGQEVMVGYWHLQAGTPLAVNPRTGQIYKPGDEIFRGELLGYTGKTGNAYNVTNKHLHLIYKVKNANGRFVYANPEKIINGTVNWKDGDSATKQIIDGLIINIICDTEITYDTF
jgi:hypothetical protein